MADLEIWPSIVHQCTLYSSVTVLLVVGRQPTIEDRQPTVEDRQPTVEDRQPTVEGRQAGREPHV